MAKKLCAEIKDRFAKILDVSHPEYDPIYAISTFLDPKYSFTLDEEQIDIAVVEIKGQVCNRMFAYAA